MKWTHGQVKTIETRDKNILVSAAAGSGKTAVLIERIKELIIKDKIDVDRFLITTFTNAASAEMKERLERAFREELEKEDADRSFLEKQLSLLPRANISTFHTFALEVIKRYFYLTDLEPGFSIGDEVQISIFKDESADTLFEERFENDSGRFEAFLRRYSGSRNEKALKKNIISIYDEMRSLPDYMKWAEERNELLFGENLLERTGIKAFIEKDVFEKLKEAAALYRRAAETLKDGGVESLWKKAAADAEKTEEAARAAEGGSLEKAGTFLKSPGFSVMRALKAEQEAYSLIKDRVSSLRRRGKKIIDDLSERYFKRSFGEQEEELKASAEDTRYFIGLVKDFERIFSDRKRKKTIVDFDDVMHYAIKILDNTTAAGEYRERFVYIFIDEFQDSNTLQERIIERISRENNLFMVGDVKQSIYKFRLAEPEIFKRKYRQYREDPSGKSISIDLNDNFRSKIRVTETVNAVFEELMEEYDENARLNCGTDPSKPGCSSALYLIDKGSGEGDLQWDDIQKEAALTVRLIRETLGQEIFDVKKSKTRRVEYRDIAVLCRSRALISEFERFLNNEGIPAYAENTGSYFESVEIQVFMNLLKIVDNTRQDVPLISAMRSAVFDFNVRELAEIRIAFPKGSFYEGVKGYGEKGENEELALKTRKMLEKISYWKSLKKTLPLEELVRTLLYDTGYFDYCGGLPVGKRRIYNLRLLVEKAAQFEKISHSGLYGFLSYVEAMGRTGISVSEAKSVGEKENVVRIMTVHKSKGLEFPVVILAGAGRIIRTGGTGRSIIMHKDMGIALPLTDPEEKWYRKTLLQKAIEAKKAKEELDEEIRILYVAMTRAVDQLIITGCVKDAESLERELQGKKSFVDMVYAPVASSGGEIHRIFPGELEGEDMPANGTGEEPEKRSETSPDRETEKNLRRVLEFSYPYRNERSVKSKYSVTELSSPESESVFAAPLLKPAFSAGRRELTPAEKGTAVHKVMERIDFKKAAKEGEAYILRRIEELEGKGVLTEEEKRAADPQSVVAFFKSGIGKRAAEALSLDREREFIMEKEIDGQKTIVQGIIDCFFEEEDGMILIDYKNSRVNSREKEEEIKRRYEGQIALYREALEASTGKKVKEAYLYLFDIKKFVEMG